MRANQPLDAHLATLKEEVMFDRSKVTGVDWHTYPVARWAYVFAAYPLRQRGLRRRLYSRRALFIAPFALAGMVPLCACREDEAPIADTGEEVTIVEFNDAGVKLGPTRVTKMVRSNAEWRKQLSAEQFYVTRQRGTDTAFSGTYYQMHASGLFRCICCADALFSSDTKFDSETGWPSFWALIAEENVRTRADMSMLIKRTEVHCTRCDAHLGHLFNDGPQPTYQRYCMNESSLRFVAQTL